MTEAQTNALRRLCESFRVEFDPNDYRLYPADSWMMPGWVEGWVGGSPGTLYVGVSPEGESHS